MTPVVHDDCYAIEDRLNFTDYRKIIGDVIQNADTPLTIGIFGPWGSGKTSLLRMLKADVDKKGLHYYRPVWFTAWKYVRAEALWRAFILRVLDALYPRKPGEGPLEDRERIPPEELGPGQRKEVEKLRHLEESVYRPVDWEELGRWAVNWRQAVREGGKAVAEVAAAFLPGAAVFKKVLEVLGGDLKAEEELQEVAGTIRREIYAYHLEQLASMEQFENRFKEALGLVLGDKGRLIVFIDDLDRCLPEKAIEVLEAIKLFLDVQGCVFVIGVDRRVVEQGIEMRYPHLTVPEKDIAEDLPTTGDFYLQKMIQLPFHLPPLTPEDIEEYIDELQAKAGLERIPEPGPRIFALGLPSNPRQVKCALNMFHTLWGIAKERLSRGELKHPIAWPLLIKTIVIQIRFRKDLYRDWLAFPTLVQHLENAYRGQPAGTQLALTSAGPTPALTRDNELAGKEAQDILSEQGLLLSKYLTNERKYRPIGEMLAFGEEPTHETLPEERQLFKGLTRDQLMAHIHLASAAAEPQPLMGTTDAELGASLLSGDPVRMKDAVLAVQGKEKEKPGTSDAYRLKLIEVLLSGAPERMRNAVLAVLEKDQAETRKEDRYRRKVMEVLRAGGVAFSTQECISAGTALGYLGDLRPGVSDGPMMMPIPAGDFRYGEDNAPAPVEAFHIGLYPVTNAQYKEFLDAKGRPVPFVDEDWARPYNWDREKCIYPEGKSNHPVVLVSWDDAQAYCEWLIEQTGKRFRLPKEVEWEKAARGDKGQEYPWPGEFDPDKANTSESGVKGTTPVGIYPDGASPYGVFDCAGNVLEWTADEHEGGGMVLRGGSWSHNQFDARCTARVRYFRNQRDNFIGFRVAY